MEKVSAESMVEDKIPANSVLSPEQRRVSLTMCDLWTSTSFELLAFSLLLLVCV